MNKQSKIDIVDEHSEIVREVLDCMPNKVLQMGISIIALILIALFFIASFVKYPDNIEGTGIVTTNPLSIHLKVGISGRIAQLFVADGAIVTKGAPIAEIESNTGYFQIVRLEKLADSINAAMLHHNLPALKQITQQPLYALGDAQPFYNTLVQQLSTYLLQKEEHIYDRRKDNLQSQMQRYQSVAAIGSEEQKLVDEELRQAADRFALNEQLYKDKVISKMEYYDEAAKVRQRKLALESQRRTAAQNDIVKGENRKQQLDIQYDKAEKERTLQVAIEEALRNLSNYTQGWKLKYLQVAPYDGILRYLKPMQQKETANAGDELFAVVPAHYHYTALINLPAIGSGKVKVGQKVQLMLPKYPYQEYGFLEGKVLGISELPVSPGADNQGQTYRVTIELQDSLITSYHKTLAFTPEMAATAKIITRDRNLLQRLIDGLMGWGR